MDTRGLRTGPPVRVLETKLKNIQEYEHWKYSVKYHLRLVPEFRPYLEDDFVFGAKSAANPHRRLTPLYNDREEVITTAEERCHSVDFMLDTICQFTPKIPHNDIYKDCRSLAEVWEVVRLNSGIETSGALLNDAWNITRSPNETPQELYSRIKQAYDDALIRRNTLNYKEDPLDEDEELSPTLHCTIILHWLQVLHPKLRDLVSQRFCTELRDNSYAAIWPEISRTVEILLKELSTSADGVVCRVNDDSRSFDSRSSSSRSRGFSRFRGGSHRSNQSKQCDYCRLMNRQSYRTHSIDDCMFLKRERRFPQGNTRAVDVEEYDEHLEEYYNEFPNDYQASPSMYPPPSPMNKMTAEHIININRITVESSPFLTLSCGKSSYDVTLDTGGTCSAVDAVSAKEMGCSIRPTYQRARCADSMTLLDVVGETDVDFTRHGNVYTLNALVFNSPDRTVLAGVPFMKQYDISVRPARSQVEIHGVEVFNYKPQQSSKGKIRRLQSFTARSPTNSVILPGESMEFSLPGYLQSSKSVAVEPRFDNSHNVRVERKFPTPKVYQVHEGSISFTNSSCDPVVVKKNEHVCNILPPVPESDMPILSNLVSPPPVSSCKKTVKYSAPVLVNPDGSILNAEETQMFRALVEQYDEVFNPTIGKYNGKSGACFVEVNMGPNPPPQHKGRVPFYGRDNLVELQQKFDELVAKGVFKRPQDIGITAEIMNPSFLVKKSDGINTRLVTDFGSIADYCRPTPTLMPDVDSTLRLIAGWGYIIKADFKESYWQIPLRRSSMKYCGVASPMKGAYVYTVGCMGLPGTEVALEELTCKLFGDLVMKGKVAKLADDLFIGGNTPQELYDNFAEVLGILAENNLRLSSKKTIIAPKSVNLLGWIWSQGHLSACPHKLSALSECSPPPTVKALKSYIGAFRFLARVVKDYASLLQPLEGMISGQRSPNAKVEWSDSQLTAFRKAQSSLKGAKSVVLPQLDDVLQIITDAAVQPTAIGAVMYAIRQGRPLLAGFYNARLPLYQTRWLPCELEGVAIGAALNHFGPYIRQSKHKPIILTDSKPCCDAIDKFKRGEFSASSRLCTFLSSVHRYGAVVKHIQGVSNVVSDYISRNPVTCTHPKCQICSFLKESMDAVVSAVSVADVISGKVQLPFTNKRAWIEIQEECSDLRHVVKFIRNGTTPGKKGRNFRQVKRYMTSKVVLSAEGTLVVRQVEPLSPVAERIVVPQNVLHGILTVLHIRLEHPSCLQLTKSFNRFFFALNLDKAALLCSRQCHHCESLKAVPKAMREQSTEDPPSHVGQRFAGDVVKRNSQLIMTLRETVSSYTLAEIIPSETIPDLTSSIQRLSNLMRPSSLVPITIRLDPHPSHRGMFIRIQNDEGLASHNVKIEIGRELNVNKNPVAEKAVRELIRELQVLSPQGGQVSVTQLSQAVANLNSRIRAPGLSAYEVFTHREQNTGNRLQLDDLKLIQDQYQRRCGNHKSSEVSKSGGKPPHPAVDVSVGDIIYLYDDRSKLTARPRYLVISVADGWCYIRRLTDKLLGARTYKVKPSECYLVKDEFEDISLPQYPGFDEDPVEVYPDHTDVHRPLIQSDASSGESTDADTSMDDDYDDETSSEDTAQEDAAHGSEDDAVQEDEAATEEGDAVQEDVEQVPESPVGKEDDDSSYPCSMCHKEVLDDDAGLSCDTCGDWCHVDCGDIDDHQYQQLEEKSAADESIHWDCPACSHDEVKDPPFKV